MAQYTYVTGGGQHFDDDTEVVLTHRVSGMNNFWVQLQSTTQFERGATVVDWAWLCRTREQAAAFGFGVAWDDCHPVDKRKEEE